MFAYKPKDDSVDLVVRVFVGQSVKMDPQISLALRTLSGSGGCWPLSALSGYGSRYEISDVCDLVSNRVERGSSLRG